MDEPVQSPPIHATERDSSNSGPPRIRELEPSQQWTLETLKVFFATQLAEMDRRYQDRFESSQLALTAAFTAQKEAVATALVSAEKAVNAALSASKEAVLKAEMAADKRFEGVNEFRSTLADQQRTLMPRSEAEAINAAMAAKLFAAVAALEEKIRENSKRIDALRSESATHEASGRGGAIVWAYVLGGAGLLVGVLSLIEVLQMNRYLDGPTALVAVANLALVLAVAFIPGLLAVLGGVLIGAVMLVSLLWWGDRAEMMKDRARWGRSEKGVEGRESYEERNFTCGTCGESWPNCGHDNVGLR